MVENVTETTVERPKGRGRGLVDYLLDGVGILNPNGVNLYQ